MARKTGKGGKFRNVHCRTWNMARKLKITKMRMRLDLEYGKKIENHGK
ncbi:hypothetical protein T02_12275 [Trichinella nativa]|uniref:Uncharacterized protein n=1 Tax=Trichinella nativa TaxID=6335 RepID=A0A0V1K7M9_9BILA|nr:hypothetical protein T02_12275 [Trichinella nativa]